MTKSVVYMPAIVYRKTIDELMLTQSDAGRFLGCTDQTGRLYAVSGVRSAQSAKFLQLTLALHRGLFWSTENIDEFTRRYIK